MLKTEPVSECELRQVGKLPKITKECQNQDHLIPKPLLSKYFFGAKSGARGARVLTLQIPGSAWLLSFMRVGLPRTCPLPLSPSLPFTPPFPAALSLLPLLSLLPSCPLLHQLLPPWAEQKEPWTSVLITSCPSLDFSFPSYKMRGWGPLGGLSG